MLRFLLAFFTVTLSLFSSAQIYNPVKWSFSAEQLSGDEYQLNYKAKIEKGWHLYATKLPSDEGPVATSFYPTKGKHYKALGEVKDGKTISKYDKVFEMELSYYETSAVFTQRVKWTGDEPISGELEFMVCTEERCLPPEIVEYQFAKPGKAASSQKEAVNKKEETKSTSKSTEKTTESKSSKIFTPVQWTSAVKDLGEGNYEVYFHFTIEEGWHLYSQNLPGEDGPIPTSFTFNEQEGLELLGKTQEPKPILKYDPNFLMDLTFFEGEVTFTQKIKASQDVEELSGSFEYMV
ncbi:MAG: protein-disulfide reductase DsbD domain-containing protein, partial [Luteibaculum sp.]